MTFSIVVLKPSFSQSRFRHNHLFLLWLIVLEFDHSAFGSHWRW